MYEFDVTILPNDILELAMIHNKSFFPPDMRPRGYGCNGRYFFVYYDTKEDMGKRPVPLTVKGDLMRVGGPLLDNPSPSGYDTIAIEWGQVAKMLRVHTPVVPLDSELLCVKAKPGDKPGEGFYFFRLVMRTNQKERLQFDEAGNPKHIYIKPARVDGEVVGNLQYVGQMN